MSEEGKTPLASDDAFEEFARSLESIREAKSSLAEGDADEPVIPDSLEQAAYEYATRYYKEKTRRALSMNELNAYKKLLENGLIKENGNPPWSGSITVGPPPPGPTISTISGSPISGFTGSPRYSVLYEASPKIGWDQDALKAIAGAPGTPKVKATYAPAKGWEEDTELAPAREVVGSSIKLKVTEI
jgi:hypothetical protein